ncbi:MerR family transcriptional regulator [Maribellus sp. CM-23]|uniref:MerR family transcriptional regulator n=1 Tax=Maribellus sp. CM-23 TaxID=2781026 RepID=UPI001F1C1DC7|nr:MerR family transcriptional regulator [Maribellus sp. CM-23]MCE4564397.1 MerR family transcriptional regulator [Maribellus sp. CM-23]
MSGVIVSDNEPLYTLSIAAKLSQTAQHSIRQYIDRGLLIPHKKESRRHLFSNSDIQRLIWIRKCLEENGLNFAGIKAKLALIPCWKITNCSLVSRKNCDAYYSSSHPCWVASQKGEECKNRDCKMCEVYRSITANIELKSLLRKYLP